MTSSRAPANIIPRTFPGISLDEVEELIAYSEIKDYPPETLICREGAVEDTFYLILDGEVQVSKVINNMETRLLKTLSTGDFFGEMALIQNAPRAATVKAVSHVVVLEINKDAFNTILRHSSSISIALVREISRRLRENDELAIQDLRIRARELADAYQRLAEEEVLRRDFLTNIAHQLRNPLMAAAGYLQIIQQGMVPPEELPGVLDTVYRNVQHIATLMNDVLFVQEMDLILDNFRPVNLGDLLSKVIERHKQKAEEKKVEVRVRIGRSVPLVSGDVSQLEKAFASLVDNAIKFSHEGGKVDVRIQRQDEQVMVAVRDEGIGIQSEAMPYIFDRFYHLDRSGDQLFEGLGLGLAIAKQVIEQHKGKLEVASTPGKGSTFTVRLNARKAESAAGKVP